MVYPGKVVRGDKVAVLSASAGLPGMFPLPFDLGCTRLREDFGLVPVDFGHTDPQLVIFYGGRARIDGPAKRITVTY